MSPKKSNQTKQIEHYNAVLIEDLRHEFKFVVETMHEGFKAVHQKMDKHFAKILAHSAKIRQDHPNIKFPE